MDDTTRDVPVGRHLAACPECGGRIQATVEVHLDNVVVAQREDYVGEIIGFTAAFGRNEPRIDVRDLSFVRLYCSNDCDLSSLLNPLPSVKV